MDWLTRLWKKLILYVDHVIVAYSWLGLAWCKEIEINYSVNLCSLSVRIYLICQISSLMGWICDQVLQIHSSVYIHLPPWNWVGMGRLLLCWTSSLLKGENTEKSEEPKSRKPETLFLLALSCWAPQIASCRLKELDLEVPDARRSCTSDYSWKEKSYFQILMKHNYSHQTCIFWFTGQNYQSFLQNLKSPAPVVNFLILSEFSYLQEELSITKWTWTARPTAWMNQ